MVYKPGHTQGIQFLIKKFHTLQVRNKRLQVHDINTSGHIWRQVIRNRICTIEMKSRTVWTLTNWPASKGMYSIIANRTRHLVSSANSTMAGNKLCDSCLMPIT